MSFLRGLKRDEDGWVIVSDQSDSLYKDINTASLEKVVFFNPFGVLAIVIFF